MGGNVEPLPQHQAERRFTTALQCGLGEQVEIEEGQAAIGAAQYFGADPCGGEQLGACLAQLFGQRQQCLGVGHGHQFGGEIEGVLH